MSRLGGRKQVNSQYASVGTGCQWDRTLPFADPRQLASAPAHQATEPKRARLRRPARGRSATCRSTSPRRRSRGGLLERVVALTGHARPRELRLRQSKRQGFKRCEHNRHSRQRVFMKRIPNDENTRAMQATFGTEHSQATFRMQTRES